MIDQTINFLAQYTTALFIYCEAATANYRQLGKAWLSGQSKNPTIAEPFSFFSKICKAQGSKADTGE